MNRQVQAAMRSGLIFPGAGQLFLGRRRRALAFALAVLAALGWLLATLIPPIVASAQAMVPDLLDGRLPTFTSLIGQSHQILADAATSAIAPFWSVVAVWASSIIDAWLLAR